MIDVTAHNEDTGTSFPGTITLPSGDEVEADLELGTHRIRLSAAGSPVGEWGFGECRLEAAGDGSFELIADDEVLGFSPQDPDGFWMAFLAAFEADRLDASPEPEPGPEGSRLQLVEGPDQEEAGPPAGTATEDEADRLRSGRLRIAPAVAAARGRSTEGVEGDADGDGHVSVSDHLLADLRTKTSVRRFSAEDVRDALKKVAIVLLAMAVVGLLAWTTPQMIEAFGAGAEATATTAGVPATTTVPTTTSTTIPEPVPTTVADPAAFDLTAPAFFSAWNEIGGEITSALEFSAFPPAGPFENEFTSFLRSEGVIGADGTLDTFSVIVDPRGPTASDRLGLQTLGVMIAVMDPSVSPEGRAQILAALGLDVRRPRLEGIDGETVRGSVRYRLVYDPESVLLTFTATAAP